MLTADFKGVELPAIINRCMETLPFLTHMRLKDTNFLCLILNSDEKILTFYDLDAIKTDEEVQRLMSVADAWWSESNRLLPISIFMREGTREFQKYLRTVNRKDIEIIEGPCTSLNKLINKRTKKKQISLMRKPK